MTNRNEFKTELTLFNDDAGFTSVPLRVPDSDPFVPENPPDILTTAAESSNKQSLDDNHVYDNIHDEGREDKTQVSRSYELIYHTIDPGQPMSESSFMATQAMIVPPDVSNYEHMYHTLDKRGKNKHGGEEVVDASKLSQTGDANETPNSQSQMNIDPKYDEPIIFPNRTPPHRATHSSSPSVKAAQNEKMFFDDPTYASSFNPAVGGSSADKKGISLNEDHPKYTPPNPHPPPDPDPFTSSSLPPTIAPWELFHNYGSSEAITNIYSGEVSEPEAGVVSEPEPGGVVFESETGGAVSEPESGGVVSEPEPGGVVFESETGGAVSEPEVGTMSEEEAGTVSKQEAGDTVEESTNAPVQRRASDPSQVTPKLTCDTSETQGPVCMFDEPLYSMGLSMK